LASTYTQLAVTDLWRVQQKVAPSTTMAEAAERRFAESRAQVHDAIQTLATATLLTPLGQDFVAAMRRSADL
jgi:HEXXH motif-containing protein